MKLKRNIFGKIKKFYFEEIDTYINDNYQLFETKQSDLTPTEYKYSEESEPIVCESSTDYNTSFESEAIEPTVYSDVVPANKIRYSLQSASDFQQRLLHGPGLDEILENIDDGFGVVLIKTMMLKNKTATDIYKNAGISRQLFNSVTNNKSYHPSKQTVMALVCALELTYSESEKMLEYAGYAFSPSSKFDLIIGYCIKHKIYNVMDINELLNYYDQELLGSK